MNRLSILLGVIFGASSLALGQATTMPAVDAPVKVLVIPFAQIGNTDHEWVGAALQESLMTEVSGDSAVQAMALNRPLARGDMSQVTAAAKDAGATLVVFGAYQYSADSQLRVTGEVLDVNFGRAVGTLKATGALVDLFKIEDSLSGQVQAALPQAPSNAPVVATNGPDQSTVPVFAGNAPATAAAPPATTYVYQSPPVDSSPTYVYSDPAYGYPYYYYGGFPVVIGGGWGWGRPYYYHGFGGGFHGGFGGGFHGGGFHGGGGHGR